jgi:hypothetical protein
MKKLVFLYVCLLGSLFYANAQYNLGGNATSLGGECYRLTSALEGQAGSLWFQNKITLASDFTIESVVNLGTVNSPGADGLAFVLQPICNGIGGAGGGIGYFGIAPSLAVELDTYQNTDRNDPVDDHIGLMVNGSVTHGLGGANVLQGFTTVPNLEDGVNRTFKIEWIASTKNLKVTLEGNELINYSGDIVTNIFGGNKNVFWGFTAATGSEHNVHTVCITSKSFTQEGSFVVTKPTCPYYNNGGIDLNPAGGIGPFSYTWSNGAITEDISGISAGTYSVAVRDGNGCVSNFSILVENELDVTPPVITCNDDITVANDAGLCGAVVNYEVKATDNCANCTPPTSIPGYTLYGSFGGHTYFRSDDAVLWAAANTAANATGGHLATVTSAAENAFLSNNVFTWIGLSDQVTENTFKWVTGEPFSYSNWGSGEPNNNNNEDQVEINRGGPGLWNDLEDGFPRRFYVEFDCMTVIQTGGLPSGSSFPVGTTTNTFEVTDAAGLKATCSFDVTVTDNEKPIAKCKPATVTLAGGMASISAADINDGSTDNCGIQSITVAPTSFTCNNIGANTVVLTVTDIHGNVSTCSAVVTVVGEIPTCSITAVPENAIYTGGIPTNIYIGYGPQSVTLTPTVTGGGPYTYAWTGNGVLSCTNCPSPVFAPTAPGVYAFTMTLTNGNGCTTTCSITICVLDVVAKMGPDGVKKVYICHVPDGNPANAHTIEVGISAVPAHINANHGDRLGKCDQVICGSGRIGAEFADIRPNDAEVNELTVKVSSNPTTNHFTLFIQSNEDSPVTLRIHNMTGLLMDNKSDLPLNSSINVGENFKSGAYFAEILQGDKRKIVKLLKAN